MGKTYVSGGASDDAEQMDTFVVFDPQANTWTDLASMGTGRRYTTPPQRWGASCMSSAGILIEWEPSLGGPICVGANIGLARTLG